MTNLKKKIIGTFIAISVLSIPVSFKLFDLNIFKSVDITLNINSNKQDELVNISAQKKIAFLLGYEAQEISYNIRTEDIKKNDMPFLSKVDNIEAGARTLGFIDKEMFNNVRNLQISQLDKLTDYNKMITQIAFHLKKIPVLYNSYLVGENLQILIRTASDIKPSYSTLTFYHDNLEKSLKSSNLNDKIFTLPKESAINYKQVSNDYVKIFLNIQNNL